MQLQPGDVCVTDVRYTPSCYIVLEVLKERADSYLALNTKNREIVLIGAAGLHKIGAVLPELGVAGVKELMLQKPKPPEFDSDEYTRGNIRAHREAMFDLPENRARWLILAKANPGDSITVHNRSGSEQVTFHHVLERGKKFVFLAVSATGEFGRYPLGSLCLGPGEHG